MPLHWAFKVLNLKFISAFKNSDLTPSVYLVDISIDQSLLSVNFRSNKNMKYKREH